MLRMMPCCRVSLAVEPRDPQAKQLAGSGVGNAAGVMSFKLLECAEFPLNFFGGGVVMVLDCFLKRHP